MSEQTLPGRASSWKDWAADPSDPVYAGLVAAILGLVPFCVPLQLLIFPRAGSRLDFLLVALPLYAALMIGILVGRKAKPRLAEADTGAQLTPAASNVRTVARLLLILSSLGNTAVALAAVVVLGLQNVLQYRDFYGDLPALSLITQYHVAFLLPFVALSIRSRKPWKLVTAISVFALFLRATLLAERLGLAEAMVALVLALGIAGVLRFRLRHIISAGMMGAVLWFGTEFSRNYYLQTGKGVAFSPAIIKLGTQWVAERFVGYYADTGNKLLFAARNEPPTYKPDAFSPVPLRALRMLRLARTYVPSDRHLFKDSRASGIVYVEFTNSGGATLLVLDWGVAGAVVFLLLFGFGVGLLAQRARAGEAISQVLYAGAFIAVLEIPRVFYLGLDRYVVPMVLSAGFLMLGMAIPRIARAPSARPVPL